MYKQGPELTVVRSTRMIDELVVQDCPSKPAVTQVASREEVGLKMTTETCNMILTTSVWTRD